MIIVICFFLFSLLLPLLLLAANCCRSRCCCCCCCFSFKMFFWVFLLVVASSNIAYCWVFFLDKTNAVRFAPLQQQKIRENVQFMLIRYTSYLLVVTWASNAHHNKISWKKQKQHFTLKPIDKMYIVIWMQN